MRYIPCTSNLTLFMKKSFHWTWALCHTGHPTFLSESWFFFYFLQTLHWYIFFSQCRQSSRRKAVYNLGSLFPKLYESLKNRHKSWYRYGYGVSFVHLEVPLIYDHLWRCWWHFSLCCCCRTVGQSIQKCKETPESNVCVNTETKKFPSAKNSISILLENLHIWFWNPWFDIL